MSVADAAASDSSLLSRKFGPEVVNYFSGACWTGPPSPHGGRRCCSPPNYSRPAD